MQHYPGAPEPDVQGGVSLGHGGKRTCRTTPEREVRGMPDAPYLCVVSAAVEHHPHIPRPELQLRA